MATTFTLPDGRTVDVGDGHLRSAEVLFQPALIGRRRTQGVAEMLSEIVRLCDADRENSQLRALSSFVLAVGGGSMLGNFGYRLSGELTQRSSYKRDIFVSALQEPERHHAAWIGGSIVSALPGFVANNFVAKAEWDEEGASAIHKRC
eukprot:UC1_evm1s827